MNNKKAFTIIEVVLVLAVAGLIFLVVFAAIPRLQASRRDNQRKRDLEALISLALEFQGNVGRLPSEAEVRSALEGTTTSVFYPYVENVNLEDPSTGANYIYYNHDGAGVNGDNETGEYRWFSGGWRCNPAGTGWSSTGEPGWFAVVWLERGTYCLDGDR